MRHPTGGPQARVFVGGQAGPAAGVDVVLGDPLRSVWSEIPRSLAIRATGSPQALTRRIASARNSGGYGGRERGTSASATAPASGDDRGPT
jgi:hypothetical protein